MGTEVLGRAVPVLWAAVWPTSFNRGRVVSPTPTEQALAQMGRHTRFVQMTPRKQTVEGVCIGVRATGSMVKDSSGEYPGVQFCIETKGGKKVWTTTFADRGPKPLGHPLWGECDCADPDEHHRRVMEEAP